MKMLTSVHTPPSCTLYSSKRCASHFFKRSLVISIDKCPKIESTPSLRHYSPVSRCTASTQLPNTIRKRGHIKLVRLSTNDKPHFVRSLRGIADSQTDLGDDDPDAGGFAAAATKRVTAATKRQLQTIASAVVSKKRQKLDDVSSLMNATAGKFRRIASESSLGHRLVSKVSKKSEQKRHRKVLPGSTCERKAELGTCVTIEEHVC